MLIPPVWPQSDCQAYICFYEKQQKVDPRMGKTDSFLKSIGLLRAGL